MDFTLWFGPFPLRWVARIEALEAQTPEVSSRLPQSGRRLGLVRGASAGFADRQVRGPFAHWLHRHLFIPLDDQTTAVVDEIELKFRRHPLWGPVGVGMWLSLPFLFAYRARKTRRLLEKRTAR